MEVVVTEMESRESRSKAGGESRSKADRSRMLYPIVLLYYIGILGCLIILDFLHHI